MIARMVFNALDHGVLVQGPLGRVAAANPAAAEILGVDRDDLVGSRLEQITGALIRADGSTFDPDELPGRLAYLSGKPQLDVPIGLPLADGTLRWIEVSSRPLRSEGEVFAVVSAIRDVTERPTGRGGAARGRTPPASRARARGGRLRHPRRRRRG